MHQRKKDYQYKLFESDASASSAGSVYKPAQQVSCDASPTENVSVLESDTSSSVDSASEEHVPKVRFVFENDVVHV